MKLISSGFSIFYKKQKQLLSQLVNKSEKAIKNIAMSKFGLDIGKYDIAGTYNFSVDYTETIEGLGLSVPSDKKLNTDILINPYVIKNLEKNIDQIDKIKVENISDSDAKNIMAHQVVIHEMLHKVFSVDASINSK